MDKEQIIEELWMNWDWVIFEYADRIRKLVKRDLNRRKKQELKQFLLESKKMK